MLHRLERLGDRMLDLVVGKASARASDCRTVFDCRDCGPGYMYTLIYECCDGDCRLTGGTPCVANGCVG